MDCKLASLLCCFCLLRLTRICHADVVTGGESQQPGAGAGADRNNEAPSDVAAAGSNRRQTVEDLHHQPSDGLSVQQRRRQHEDRIRNQQRRIVEIQNRIIMILGITHRPNVPPNNLTREDLQLIEDMIKNDTHGTTENEFLKRYQTSMPVCAGPRNSDRSWNDGSAYRLYFSVDGTEANNRNRQIRVDSANLKLKMKPILNDLSTTAQSRRRSSTGSSENNIIKLTIFSYGRPVRRNRNDIKTSFKNLTIFRNASAPWVRINIKALVEDWHKRPNKNFGLQLVVRDGRNQELDPFLIFESAICDSNQSSQTPIQLSLKVLEESFGHNLSDSFPDSDFTNPYMDMVSTEIPKPPRTSGRQRRDLFNFKSASCTLQKMNISFDDMGLGDWVVQPKRIEAGFCTGSCSKRQRHRDEIENQVSQDQYSCGGTRFKPLSIMIFNNKGEQSVVNIDDMLVTQCGCNRNH